MSNFIQKKSHSDGRLDYLKILSEIAAKLKSNIPLEELCSDICEMIRQTVRYTSIAVVRVQIGSILRMSPDFHTTQWGLVRDFLIENDVYGRFEVYYTAEKKWSGGYPFIKEEEDLLDNIAGLLSGAATKAAFKRLLIENTERLKELGGITRIISILQENRPIQVLLADICKVIPHAWQYPEYTGARILYGDLVFSTENFLETQWMQRQSFSVPEGPDGVIEVCYLKEFPQCDEGPFLKEERNLIVNLAQLIAAAAGSKMYEQLVAQNRERLKELNAINQTTQIITHGKNIADTLQSVSTILPQSFQFSEFTVARITFGGKEYVSKPFEDTPWVLREQLVTIDNQIGIIEVFYLREFPTFHEGPFLKEERNLLQNIARLLAHFINNYKGRLLLEHAKQKSEKTIADHLGQAPTEIQHELRALSGHHHRNVFTSYFVRDVLFIASPYDAFAIQSESLSIWFKMDSAHPFGARVPEFTIANSSQLALEYLANDSFDLVIIMGGLDLKSTLSCYAQLTQAFPALPVYVLITRPEHRNPLLSAIPLSRAGYKPVFVWNNDPLLIFAIIKLHEDLRNVAYSNAPAVLLIEDTPEVFSKIITCLYQTIFVWIEDNVASLNSVNINGPKSTYLRPHLLMVSQYEAAVHFVHQYQNRLCCVVSDVEFDKNGVQNRNAGLELIEVIQGQDDKVPCLLHSSDVSHQREADESGVCFLDKSMPDLMEKISAFITYHLQKRIFTLRDTDGIIIGQTSDICRLTQLIENASPASVYETLKNGEFVRWFQNQSEQSNADIAVLLAQSDETAVAIHQKLIAVLKNSIRSRFCGTVVRFEDVPYFDKTFITALCGGSYGGKGRGIAFLNSIVNNISENQFSPGLKICTPITAIIGTDEFEIILKSSNFKKIDMCEADYETIRECFIGAPLSTHVREGLRAFVSQVKGPIAVRSSSLFEDSLTQPFAGAFETYIIPNSSESPEIRLEQTENAVKLVFASLYRPEARTYFKLSGRGLKEERMAVAIQELVGTQFGDYYYPHISGVAGSFNYYPVAHMKPEEGFAVIAFGLGVIVVEGRSGHRFSPSYPEINFGSLKDAFNNSQVKFYAVNLNQTVIDMLKNGEKAGLDLLDIDSAEKNGSLKHCASVYDAENDRIIPNLNRDGPRLVDFADILKYNYIPLASSLQIILKMLSERMETPVEIEFAVTLPHANNNLQSSELYVLQVKPLVGDMQAHEINTVDIDPESVLLYSETALGNGTIDTITDIVLVDITAFDRMKTDDIAREVEYFNRKLSKENRHYVLIGPGRWGTRDKSLGIPVVWAQISNARVIVELGFVNYPLDASLGSHFFHNLTAMNTGYMAIIENRSSEFIKWNAFAQATLLEHTKYVKHFRFSSPLIIEMDGRRRKAVVCLKGKE